MKSSATLLLLGAVLFGALVVSSDSASAAPPLPTPPPPPVPNGDATALIAQAQALLAQAAASPGSVSPTQLRTLAAQLNDKGQTALAMQLLQLASLVELQQGSPIVATPQGVATPDGEQMTGALGQQLLAITMPGGMPTRAMIAAFLSQLDAQYGAGQGYPATRTLVMQLAQSLPA